MDNTNKERDTTKIGKGKPGPGRPPKAVEFGLSAIMNKAWPEQKRIEAIEHIAGLVVTARSEKTRVEAAELLLKYAYGTPKAVDVVCTVDLTKDIKGMTPEEREIHKIELMQYALARGIQL